MHQHVHFILYYFIGSLAQGCSKLGVEAPARGHKMNLRGLLVFRIFVKYEII